jgi:hypothetical protein
MVRILSTVAFALLLTNFAMAQSYCDQVKQAVATYGYAAAKAHSMAHYSAREVAVADKCGAERTGPSVANSWRGRAVRASSKALQ